MGLDELQYNLIQFALLIEKELFTPQREQYGEQIKAIKLVYILLYTEYICYHTTSAR